MRPSPAAALLLALAGRAVAAEPATLTSRIAGVTVYADRAQVTRTASVELPSEAARFAVTRLPGWIDAESVRVALDPPGAGQVLDVSVETAYLAEASEEAVRVATAALRDVSDEIAAVADEERTLNEEIARLDALRAMALDKVPRELAVGDLKVKSLGETMAYVTETIRTDRKQLRDLAKKRRDLEPILTKKQHELSDLQARAQLQQSSVVVELKGRGTAALHVTYLTPGAAWEPLGEMRVSRGGTAVNVLQYATVIQTTGEDWAGAHLSFSTQNPSTLLDVPRARGLLLDRSGDGLGDMVGRLGESFLRAQAIYAQRNESVARTQSSWRSSIQVQNEVQTRATERFAQIAQRGTTAHFAALADRTVRADGKPVRVAIAAGNFGAVTKIVAVPEVSLNAVRVADLVNGGSYPILPGRAMLFEDGAFVGRSDLDFVAPGERFSLFLGLHDRVKLERTLDKKSSALRRHGKRTDMTLSFVGTAENLGATPLVIEISERIPVAQTEEIELDDIELPRKLKPDQQGVVRWTETIPARSKVTWRVGYKLEYPTDFVVRSRAAFTADPSPAAPAARARKMYEQIEVMEKSL
jgi:uncharacterized protein (TIGR02231 family)